MSTPWPIQQQPPRGFSVYTRLQKGLPISPAERLLYLAERRIRNLSKEDREVLEKAIRKQLARDLAKLGEKP
jgi:hypothetical protein